MTPVAARVMAEYRPLGDTAPPALDAGLQSLLVDIAEQHFGADEWTVERSKRVRIADMLLAGLTREQVAESSGCPLADVPVLLTAAPKTLQ